MFRLISEWKIEIQRKNNKITCMITGVLVNRTKDSLVVTREKT